MPYVERDGNGDITGVFAIKQPGTAEELLPDNNPEIIAFNDVSPPTNEEIYDQTIQNRKAFKAYVLAINDGSIVPGSNMTGAALKAAIVAKM